MSLNWPCNLWAARTLALSSSRWLRRASTSGILPPQLPPEMIFWLPVLGRSSRLSKARSSRSPRATSARPGSSIAALHTHTAMLPAPGGCIWLRAEPTVWESRHLWALTPAFSPLPDLPGTHWEQRGGPQAVALARFGQPGSKPGDQTEPEGQHRPAPDDIPAPDGGR